MIREDNRKKNDRDRIVELAMLKSLYAYNEKDVFYVTMLANHEY